MVGRVRLSEAFELSRCMAVHGRRRYPGCRARDLPLSSAELRARATYFKKLDSEDRPTANAQSAIVRAALKPRLN